MSSFHKLLLALIALPTLFALAHDTNLYYKNPEAGFKLRAAGYYWVNISPDSFKIASEGLPPETWQMINKILIFPGVYVFGITALILYAIIGFFRQKFFPEKEMPQHGRLDFLRHDREGSGYKYKRKR